MAMSTKIYTGARKVQLGGAIVTVRDSAAEGGARELAPRNDLRNHSPDGFEFGRRGSGPAQMALGICADVLGDDERALRVYQDFKRVMISPIDGDDFSITEARALEVIAEIEASRAER